MYVRLNSRRMPSMIVKTDVEWEIAEDKSCMLLKLDLEGDNPTDGIISTERHCAHVYLNPQLGSKFQIVTPDDGMTLLPSIAKSKQAVAADLPWHYKVFIVRVDLPTL